MTILEANKNLFEKLKQLYDERESAAITDRVMENITGLSKMDRLLQKNFTLTISQENTLAQMIGQLLQYRPVQYVLGEAWFMGLKFIVNEKVLIPRPETEELVESAISWAGKQNDDISCIDIGTGSGCIPVTIAKYVSAKQVHAIDVSEKALEIAAKNAESHDVKIYFHQLDFLKEEARKKLPVFDLILSNPPYIAESEKKEIDQHVLEYEPHQALFVPDGNTLVFYEAIAAFGLHHLRKNGMIMVETSAMRGNEVRDLFLKNGYEASLFKDMHGNDRIVHAKKII